MLAAGCGAPGAPESPKATAGDAAVSPEPTATAAATPAPGPYDARLLQCARIAPGVAEADALTVLRQMAEIGGGSDYCAWLESESREVIIYRSVPYGAYTLVLAMEPFDGEVAPELYALKNGFVEYRTYGSDCWSLNYTRLPGATAVYGVNFAYESDTTRVSAAFLDGQRVEQPLVRSANADGLGEGDGFILLAEGNTYLTSLTIYNGDAPVADDADGRYLMLGGDDDPWAGGPNAIRGRTHFCGSRAGMLCADESEVALDPAATGLSEASFMRINTECVAMEKEDLWRNNNAVYYTVSLPAGAKLPVNGLPDEITDAYFVRPALDIAPDDSGAAITEAALTDEAFSLAGFASGERVTLVIEAAGRAYVLPIRVK